MLYVVRATHCLNSRFSVGRSVGRLFGWQPFKCRRNSEFKPTRFEIPARNYNKFYVVFAWSHTRLRVFNWLTLLALSACHLPMFSAKRSKDIMYVPVCARSLLIVRWCLLRRRNRPVSQSVSQSRRNPAVRRILTDAPSVSRSVCVSKWF